MRHVRTDLFGDVMETTSIGVYRPSKVIHETVKNKSFRVVSPSPNITRTLRRRVRSGADYHIARVFLGLMHDFAG